MMDCNNRALLYNNKPHETYGRETHLKQFFVFKEQ